MYYHNDRIGIPHELTDEEGNIVWRGEYSGWGKLNNAEGANLKEDVHQPFRLQNQYCDQETGLHYNFFRYYDPHCGRFTQQDPIGLAGGENAYEFGFDGINWIDIQGLRGIRPNYHQRGSIRGQYNNVPIRARPNTRILNTVDRRKSDLSRFSGSNSTALRNRNTQSIQMVRNEEIHQLFDNVGNVLEDFTKKKTAVTGVCDKRKHLEDSRYKYDCDQYTPTKCPVQVPGQICYSRERFYSETNVFMTNPGTTIECQEIQKWK